jgi:hypothetical protein
VTPFPIEPKKKGEELMTGSIGDTLEHMLTQQYPSISKRIAEANQLIRYMHFRYMLCPGVP